MPSIAQHEFYVSSGAAICRWCGVSRENRHEEACDERQVVDAVPTATAPTAAAPSLPPFACTDPVKPAPGAAPFWQGRARAVEAVLLLTLLLGVGAFALLDTDEESLIDTPDLRTLFDTNERAWLPKAWGVLRASGILQYNATNGTNGTNATATTGTDTGDWQADFDNMTDGTDGACATDKPLADWGTGHAIALECPPLQRWLDAGNCTEDGCGWVLCPGMAEEDLVSACQNATRA